MQIKEDESLKEPYDELMKRVAASRRKEGGAFVFADTAGSFGGTK